MVTRMALGLCWRINCSEVSIAGLTHQALVSVGLSQRRNLFSILVSRCVYRMIVSPPRSRRSVSSRICVTPSQPRPPLATISGFQPNSGRYLANLRERCTPAPPRGGKRYDRYNSERANSTAPEACAEATPSLFDGFARRPVGCAKAVPEEWMRSVGGRRLWPGIKHKDSKATKDTKGNSF